jgi:hypothetical protein
MKPKIKITNTIITTIIAYSFYVVFFSMPTTCKLDKIIIRLQKSICKVIDVTAQLPFDIFGIKFFFLKKCLLLLYW